MDIPGFPQLSSLEELETPIASRTPSVAKKLDDLHHLLEGMAVCMACTRRTQDGRLVARAMRVAPRTPSHSGTPPSSIAPQIEASSGEACPSPWIPDLTLITHVASHAGSTPLTTKVELAGITHELKSDPHICLAFLRESTGEWVSVSGIVNRLRTVQDLDKDPTYVADFRASWSSDMANWFPDINQEAPEADSRVALVDVEALTVSYAKVDHEAGIAVGPRLGVLWDVATAALTPGMHVPVSRPTLRQVKSFEMKAARFVSGNTTQEELLQAEIKDKPSTLQVPKTSFHTPPKPFLPAEE
jgi:general stress protein 26